jgi:hypothetical protein
VLAVVGIGLTYFMRMDGFIDGAAGFIDDWSARIEQRIAATRMQEAPATAGASRPAAPPPVAEAPKEPVTAPPAPEASPPGSVRDGTAEQESSAVASAPEPMPVTPLASEPRPSPQAERKSPAKLPTRALGKTARVILAISPRGEIYVDGEHQGTTPPITTLDLQPGMHRIEVRSGSRTPYLTYVTVQAGDVRHIRYDFDAKGSRPPR